MATMQEIETKAKEHAEARRTLSQRVFLVNAEIDKIKRKHLGNIRKAVAAASASGDELLDMVAESKALFAKPKSRVLHGIKLGFKKEKGKLDFADPAQVIKLIRKHFPELEESLIVVTEKVSKEAMNTMKAEQLKKIGVTVAADGDVAFISDTASDVDKIVSALLAGVAEEAGA